MPHIRGWAGGRGRGEWRVEGRVNGLMMPSDTGDQVVYTVDQTDGYSNHGHTTRRADVEWNSLGPHATLLIPDSSPTVSLMVLHGCIGSAKSHL